ncbi:hypothetical protein [Afifella sp. H1R]|nr:hypothetical protein [Afifella sp. H1R]
MAVTRNVCALRQTEARHAVAIYAGVPCGVECFRIARRVLEEAG